MEKEFVPYELALRMKALGYDNPCFGYYDENDLSIEFIRNGNIFKETEDSIYFKENTSCLAPTFSQVFRWFREKGYLISFSSHDDRIHDFYIKWQPSKSILSDTYDTPEEAELACLDKLIEIVENEK